MQRIPLKPAHPMQDGNNLVQRHFKEGMPDGSTAWQNLSDRTTQFMQYLGCNWVDVNYSSQ